ncbi:MAG: hypothetical protein OYL97_12105 [Candidatus Poribacteria bacterium]|nr:hypothetical protein [Candidatus Poribacteria bacterium]
MDFQRGLRGETRTRASLFIGYWLSAIGCQQSVINPFQGCLNLSVMILLAGSDVPIVMCAATSGSCESLLLVVGKAET